MRDSLGESMNHLLYCTKYTLSESAHPIVYWQIIISMLGAKKVFFFSYPRKGREPDLHSITTLYIITSLTIQLVWLQKRVLLIRNPFRKLHITPTHVQSAPRFG